MSDPHAAWFDDPRATDTSGVGGKAANLARLVKAGANVPPGFAVTTYAYRKFMLQLDSRIAPLLESMNPSDIDSAEAVSREISALVSSSPIPQDVIRSISDAYLEIGKNEADREGAPVAVRSSATAEDMLSASVAGQHETFLWVRGAKSVVEHVRRCWASAFAARSLAYRQARGISQAGVEMGVVVQKMVNAETAGVMFTLNPANGDPSKISVDAAWGLGEAVVSGVVTPDLFVVDKVSMEILTRLAGKKHVEFVADGGGVVERRVPGDRRDKLCLADEEVLKIAKAGKALEKAFGKALDIEWAIDASKELYILQARPETVWSGKTGPKTESKEALDRVIDVLKRGQRVG